MTESDITRTRAAIVTLLNELVGGAPADAAYVLNPTDPGLLRALDTLSAGEASRVPPGHRSSIAAHVDHLRYGIGLMNQWADGEDPFSDADYRASWQRIVVADSEWSHLRAELARQLTAWATNVQRPRPVDEKELTGMIASVVHLAYHLGAIRQIAPALAGPRATD